LQIIGRLQSENQIGVGMFYYGYSNELKQQLDPVMKLGDEYGAEAFYNFAVTKWFRLTADVQVISPPVKGLSFPKIISGCIGDAARPRPEWLQWRQTVGRFDVTAHLSVMPNAYALDCNTLHRQKESGVGAPRRR
jgi:hypothetical protein